MIQPVPEPYLSIEHRHELEVGSGLTPDIIAKRGYWTATETSQLAALGFPESQQLVPCLVIPIHGVDGKIGHYQIKPQNPRIVNGKPLKYETRAGGAPIIDVPPTVKPLLGEVNVPLWITEGSKKADAGAVNGMCIIALLGVYGFRGRNKHKGITALADWEDINIAGRDFYVAYDNDVITKPSVRAALKRLVKFLKHRKAAHVYPVVIVPPEGSPPDAKMGLDDYFVHRGTRADLEAMVDEKILGSGLPDVIVNRQIQEVTEDAIDALVDANDPPVLFHRGRYLVRVSRDPRNRYTIEPMTEKMIRERLGQVATWHRKLKDSVSPVYPPKEICENILAFSEPLDGVPPLSGLSAVPVMGPAGEFKRERGYDDDSKWFITGSGPWTHWEGTPQEAAAWLIEELFSDFPFDSQASLANALGLAVLPLVRSIIDGPTPMHFVDAPRSRSGKGLLVDACLMPTLGDRGPVTPMPDKEEEKAKTLYTLILQGGQVIFFDNVKGKVDSQSLEACLTSTFFSSRILGISSAPAIEVRAIFALTGNNVKLSTDLAGRCAWIRITPREENPEDRKGFRHENLRGWIIDNRSRIVGALMAMVDGWITAGRPSGLKIKASYEDYSAVVGGILEVCGVAGFLGNDHQLKGSVNTDDDMWRAFYQGWYERYKWDPAIVKDLRAFARENEMLDPVFARSRNEQGQATVFGSAIAERVDTVLYIDTGGNMSTGDPHGDPHGDPCAVKIVRVTMKSGSARYKLEKVGDPGDPDLWSLHTHTGAHAHSCGVPQGSPGSPLGSKSGDPTLNLVTLGGEKGDFGAFSDPLPVDALIEIEMGDEL